MDNLKEKIKKVLVWSQKFTKTDMLYLTSGVFWVGINKVFIFLFSFFLMLAFSHLSSKENFGNYQYILSVLGVVSIASLPGLNVSLMKSIAQGKEGTFKTVLRERMKWSLLGSIIIIIIAFWYFYKSNILLGSSLILVGIAFPLFQTYDSFEYFWCGRKNFKKGMFYSNISAIIPTFILILTLFISQNLLVIIFIFLFSNSLIRYILVKKTSKAVTNAEVDASVIGLGKSLTLIQGIDIAASYIDKIFIWLFYGPIPVAIYAFAQIPISKIQQLAPIQVLSLPKLSEQNIYTEKKIIINKFLKLFLIMIPVTIIFILLIPFLYKFFFPQYLETIPYVKTLGLLIMMMPFTFLTTAMIAADKRKEITGIQTTTFIIKIILFFIYTPIYGIWGIIFVTIGIEILKNILTLYFFYKIKE